jgi:4-hydroxy-tetrahydrodipicolinate synthase
MLEIKGLYCALVTPFNDDQSLDEGGYRTLINLAIEDGIQGIVSAGCTGEPWSLSNDERGRLFKVAVDEAAGRIPVVGGTAGVSAREAIERVRLAEAAGCDAIMVQPPWYALPGMEEVYEYYREIIDATDLPIMLYNVPRRTGLSLTVDVVSRLADDPQVIALKESSKDWVLLSEMIRRCKDRMNIMVGYADLFGLAAFAEGAVGTVEAVFPPIAGRDYRKFCDAGISGDLETAARYQADFAKWHWALWGIGTFPAPVKAALNLLGRPGGRPRDPIKPLKPEQVDQVADVLVDMGLLTPERELRKSA